jgi:hypothetical protein
VVTGGEGLEGLREHAESPAGLNLPTGGSSSDLVVLFGGAIGSGFSLTGSVSERPIMDCADKRGGESARSGASLSALEASGESLQDGNLSSSGGQVEREDNSSANEAAFRRGVLSLGVGIEAN